MSTQGQAMSPEEQERFERITSSLDEDRKKTSVALANQDQAVSKLSSKLMSSRDDLSVSLSLSSSSEEDNDLIFDSTEIQENELVSLKDLEVLQLNLRLDGFTNQVYSLVSSSHSLRLPLSFPLLNQA